MKRTISKYGTVLFAAAATCLSACKKDNNGNGSVGPSKVIFAATADNSTAAVNAAGDPAVRSTEPSATNASITWTSAVANISSFKLEAKKNDSEVEIRSSGLNNVDLLAALPANISANIDTGTYREIEIKLAFVKAADTNYPLVLKGTYNGTAGAVPIEIDFNQDATLKAEAEKVTVTNTADVTAKLIVHLNKLVAGLTVAQISAAARFDGKIVISNAVNAALYTNIALNLSGALSADHFERHNHN